MVCARSAVTRGMVDCIKQLVVRGRLSVLRWVVVWLCTYIHTQAHMHAQASQPVAWTPSRNWLSHMGRAELIQNYIQSSKYSGTQSLSRRRILINRWWSDQFHCDTSWVLEHSSSCCCSNPNEGTLLLCISVCAVLVDVLMHAVDLHKTKQLPVSGLWVHGVIGAGVNYKWVLPPNWSLRDRSWIDRRCCSAVTWNLYSVGLLARFI